MDQIEIKASKSKAVLLLISSLAFVIFGIVLIYDSKVFSNNINYEQVLMGSIMIVLFGYGLFIGIKKFNQQEAQLILNEKGFFFDPKNSEYKFIEWARIIGFFEETIKFDKFLFIKVDNPEELIANENNRAKRNMMKLNLKTHGTPISVSEIGLNIDYKTLKKEIIRFHDTYGIANDYKD